MPAEFYVKDTKKILLLKNSRLNNKFTPAFIIIIQVATCHQPMKFDRVQVSKRVVFYYITYAPGFNNAVCINFPTNDESSVYLGNKKYDFIPQFILEMIKKNSGKIHRRISLAQSNMALGVTSA